MVHYYRGYILPYVASKWLWYGDWRLSRKYDSFHLMTCYQVRLCYDYFLDGSKLFEVKRVMRSKAQTG